MCIFEPKSGSLLSECFYLTQHQVDGAALGGSIAQCMDVRQNGRNLAPRTRSDYLRDCASERGECARWTRRLSAQCRAAMREQALRAP